MCRTVAHTHAREVRLEAWRKHHVPAYEMEVSQWATVFPFVLVAVAFQCTQVQIASAVECTLVSGSTCRCTLADGSGEIDLSPLFARGMLSVQGTGPEYVCRC